MVAKFTNLRPAETKPLDELLALHTPLYPWGDTTPFFDSVAQVGVPAAIPLAAARIATQAFRERAWYALMGGAPAGSGLGGPQLLALARLLARTDSGAILAGLKRRRLAPPLVAAIETARGEAPSLLYGTIRDDLLAMYLLPGAFADYRRVAGRLLVLAPRAGWLGALLDLPPVRNQVPPVWRPILLGRITFPGQIRFLPPPPPPPGTKTVTHGNAAASMLAGVNGPLSIAGQDAQLLHSLHNAGLSAADLRQLDELAANTGAVESAQTSAAGKRESARKSDKDSS